MRLDRAARGGGDPALRGPARHEPARGGGERRCGSRCRTCTPPSPRSSRAPASTRATSRWWPSAARARWSGASSPARWASPPSSCRARPGTLCALGAITTDVLNDAVRTVHGRLDALDLAALAREQRALEAELARVGRRARASRWSAPAFRHGADMRYVGQSYEIEVAVEPEWLAPAGAPGCSRPSTGRTSASSATPIPTRRSRW